MKRLVWLALALIIAIAKPSVAQNAADAFFDPEEMAQARAKLKASHGAQTSSLLMVERIEYHENNEDSHLAWEAQGWLGGDEEKLWFKTEGEYLTDDGQFEEAEIQLLYSRAVSPFWDLQAGFRHDAKPSPSRSYAVIGAQGLAPYWFELDGAVFLSDKGDISLRLESEYELRLSQRLLLQPRIELNAALSDDEQLSFGSGLSTIDAGLRLRYEIRREFAPYIGVSWFDSFGSTRHFRSSRGETLDQVSFVAGVRFWF